LTRVFANEKIKEEKVDAIQTLHIAKTNASKKKKESFCERKES